MVSWYYSLFVNNMDFAIEMPAEANPLTIQILLNVLQSASSNDQQQVTTATQQLQNWELTPGMFSLLRITP